MKIGERLLLVFMAIVFFCATLCIGVCLWSETALYTIIDLVYSSVFIKIAVSAVILILMVLSIRSMFVSTGKQKVSAALAASTNEGGIYINLDTISDLASKAVKKVDGIRELKVKTVMAEDGANIAIKVALIPDCVIPEVSAEIQKSVKSDIEALCGIAVKKIVIQVDNSLQSQKTK